MALPTPTPKGTAVIENYNFESGDADWTKTGTALIVNESQISGGWCAKVQAAGESNDGSVVSDTFYLVTQGQAISLSATAQCTTGTPGTGASVALNWYDADYNYLSTTSGSVGNRKAFGDAKFTVSVGGTAPQNAVYVKPVGSMNTSNSTTVSTIYMDNFSWNYTAGVEALLTRPTTTTYATNALIPYRVEIDLVSGSTNVTVTEVKYYYMTFDTDASEYLDPVLVATVTDAGSDSGYGFNAAAMVEGNYAAYAVVTLSNGAQIITSGNTFTVGDAAPNTREFRGSNSYTYLVGDGIIGLGSGIPSTAVVTGAEVEFTYGLEILVRSKDVGITDIEQYTSAVAFSAITGGVFEAALMTKDDAGQYTVLGSPSTINVPIQQSDFSITEDGVADEEFRWTVYTADTTETYTIGDESSLFNLDPVAATDFIDYSMGIRFFPTLGSKPSYAAEGDACVRVKLNSWKIRVYFDAGSVEYYFASPDKTDVIKGELVAYNVDDGAFSTADASGTLQLRDSLEIIDGDQWWVGDDWTIHSNYPPTDNNQIGEVAARALADGIGQSYNSLPGYWEVEDARSRYMMITSNFYGDPDWDSIYGTNGVDRAFAYNGEDFYKIQTQPDLSKDKPRHVAFHHSHLALGYKEGRVDISVVGEPYNFSGLDGASSWAIGDNVTGLTALSGAILGVFCQKSIVGISGTTVDNFATQTLSPSIGAVEYTVTDMGLPIYANAYGIYTLAQTNSYGDYLGSPLSNPVSPWLRPRLLRKSTSPKEVVCAWPVRSKNQYRVAFADGYVLTMTLNFGTNKAPDFSKQKYFIDGTTEVTDLYAHPAIVPAAISSQLDESGEERIHISNKQPEPTATPDPEEEVQYKLITPVSPHNKDSTSAPTIRLSTNAGEDPAYLVSNNLDIFNDSIAFTDLTTLTYVRGGMYLINDEIITAPHDTAVSPYEGGTTTWDRSSHSTEIAQTTELILDAQFTGLLDFSPVDDLEPGEYQYKMVFTHPSVTGEVFAVGVYTVLA